MTAVADSSGFKPTDHQALLQRMSPFAKNLIVWQKQQGRHDLPWQGRRDAYRVWLSEIMLQQTQVTTVIPYYRRFLESFPEVTALAQAPLNTVLEHWAGLGYYARARNLHRCAQLVSDEYGGQFPQTPEALAGLPGIGRSTAAAIAVFAFGARAAILDGNVKRVLARCFGIEGFPGAAPVERSLWALAETLLPEQEIEAYTQGLMDLGASLCARNKPQCAVCPQQALCVACREGRQGELPLRRPTKVLPEREARLLLLCDGEAVFLERRPPSGIWGGLLSLPECAWALAESFAIKQGCQLLAQQALPPKQHTFTHFRLTMHVLLGHVARRESQVSEPGREWLALADIGKAALPTPVRRMLQAAKLTETTATTHR